MGHVHVRCWTKRRARLLATVRRSDRSAMLCESLRLSQVPGARHCANGNTCSLLLRIGWSQRECESEFSERESYGVLSDTREPNDTNARLAPREGPARCDAGVSSTSRTESLLRGAPHRCGSAAGGRGTGEVSVLPRSWHLSATHIGYRHT